MNDLKGRVERKIKRILSPYKSQKGQDRWVIHELFGDKKGGFFLDLAAADGLMHSNTHLLEKKYQWDGICIKPNPGFYRSLQRRRKCHCVQSVVYEGVYEVDFRIDNGQLGGIVSDTMDNNERIRGGELKSAEIVRMKTETLPGILDRLKAPSVIDYFSLDVEGSEESIVTSFDFDRYGFLSMTIERPTPKVNECLFDYGYLFVKNHIFDSFYVHPDLKDRVSCEPFEQIPPKDW